MARDGGDRMLTDDELDGYGDAAIDDSKLPKVGSIPKDDMGDDEFGNRPAKKKKKVKSKGPKENPVKNKMPMANMNGLAGRMNGM